MLTDNPNLAKCVLESETSVADAHTLLGSRTTKAWVTRSLGFALVADRAWMCEKLPNADPREKGERLVLTFKDVKKGGRVLVKLGLSASGSAAKAQANLLAEIPGWDFDAKRTAADLAADFVDSMLEQGRRTGFLPIWTLWGKDNQCMIGTHSVPVIVDAWLKGCWPAPVVEDNDGTVERAYQQIKETLTKKHADRYKENWNLYDKYGYYPFDRIKGESVSRTLECAYDDACAARMARALGRDEDAAFFAKRAANWKNVFDATQGLVRGRDTTGTWRTPFDPFALGHGADIANDFTEGNAYQYTWHVMQDPQGLIAALGGAEPFAAKLEKLFTLPSKVEGAGFVSDVSGLIGQYAHGNEPSHHVVYFFQYAGRGDLTAKYVREVFDKFYLPKPDGLCGNDDCGQMSAWYLFSAMGFYPFDPCGDEYVIGAPQVPQVQVEVRGGGGQRMFKVLAKGLSKENKYVKSVTLNGKPITDWKIRHADIMKGGELVFEMCARP